VCLVPLGALLIRRFRRRDSRVSGQAKILKKNEVSRRIDAKISQRMQLDGGCEIVYIWISSEAHFDPTSHPPIITREFRL